jgi:hypothetical protein
MVSGGCLCGKVSYQYEGEIDEVSMCHCSSCRRAQGSAFVAVCPVQSLLLTFQGEQYIKKHFSSPGKFRAFCGECGSALYSAKEDVPEVKRLRIGTLSDDVRPNNRYHKFVNYKADWFDIEDGLPQYPENNV